MREFQVFLRLSAGTELKRVRASDAFDAVKFAESLVPQSTARGVTKLTPWVSA